MSDDELLQETLDAEEVTVYGDGSRQVALLVEEANSIALPAMKVWKLG